MYPALEGLREIAKSGEYRRIPVCRELYSDRYTPVEVMRTLRTASRHCYLLESASQTEVWGRYSFLGYEPSMEITCTDGNLQIRKIHEDGTEEITKQQVKHPGDAIRKILKEYKSPVLEKMPTFTGGLVGYFSYDYIKYSEPKLELTDKTVEDFRDMDLMLFDQVIAFEKDHRSEGIGIAMQDLSYSYNTGTEVFRNASIEAYPHEIVALVGPSGEGKTTMLRLILSLLQPSGGLCHVCAGDNHRTQIEMSPSTRKLFSYVPQGNTMFSGTIAENMRNVKPDATDEEIIHALQLACAWDFVEKLPDGIQSMVKERGGGFSEGQAQRLSIARALLRHSPILLLDEATSALDVATERKVLKNIMQDTYPRTCIVTTHRPTVLNICTRVYAIREKKCEVLKDEEIEKLMGDF